MSFIPSDYDCRPVFADADAIFNHFASDPEVTRYMSWPTHESIADTQAFLKFAIENWQQHSMGTLLIESNGMVIGSTGIHLGQADAARSAPKPVMSSPGMHGERAMRQKFYKPW
jgi:ribosomal-protein-alanine N-acetyltransferase